MFLIDTNVLSEIRKLRVGRADTTVAAWAASADIKDFYWSVISLREFETLVLRTERRDATQGRVLRDWFENYISDVFADRILPITERIARRCARLFVPDKRPEADALIAATALVHGLTVVTRNTSDFAPMGVRLLNPWEPQ